MITQSLYEELTIIRRVYCNDYFEINICSDGINEKSKFYTTLIIKDSELVRNTINIFSSLRDNSSFVDFVDCYIKDMDLYVLFTYMEEYRVDFKAISEIPIKQKAEYIKKILTSTIVYNIPECILYDMLTEENLNIDPSGRVYFNYFLKSVDRYGRITKKDIQKRIGRIFISIFSEEIEDEEFKELKDFIRKCEEREFRELIEIYVEYKKIYEQIICMEVKSKKEKKNLIVDTKAKMSKFYNKVKPILILTALTVGVVYAVIVILNNMNLAKVKAHNIETIGTVDFTK